jgi:hypothetical protein
MTGKALGPLAGAVLVVLLLCSGLATVLLGGAGMGLVGCATPIGSGASAAPGSGWDAEQIANATAIVTTGMQKNVPARGFVIAVATAMQESHLFNLPGGDRDSVGLFQRRPSQGWGTPAQLQNPTFAAGAFYDHLLTVDGWQQMPLTEAAQKVQRSAYPDAYAKWEDDATALVAAAVVADKYGAGTNRLGCSMMASGSAEPAPRNPDGSWPEEGCTIRPDPTTGTGCVTPRLVHLVQQTMAAGFPKPGCYRVDDHGEHPKGRACDFMMTSGGEATSAQKARGDAMAAWAVANADRLGIMYVIWFSMIWTPAEGWHPYSNPWGGDDPSGWHTNHVHISVY